MDREKLEAARREFSLFWGGPFNRLFRLTGWADGSVPNQSTRLAGVLLLGAAPVVVLSLIEGTAFGARVTVPLFGDLGALIRLLVCFPLLIAAEPPAEYGVVSFIGYLRRAGLVRPGDRGRFEALIHRMDRVSDSILPEILLVILTLALLSQPVALVSRDVGHWMFPPAGSGYTMAGFWYGYVSLSIYRFLLVRWLWRYGLWVWFLWRLSRMRLALTASHPDMAGGLRYAVYGQRGFMLLVLTISIQLSSQIAGNVLQTETSLSSYYYVIAMYAGLALVFLFGPLIAFSMQMYRCKRAGAAAYGTLGEKYTDLFEGRWLAQDAEPGEPLLGTADIQSLADLANSYSVVRDMKTVPFDRGDLILALVAIVVPFLPLVLFVYRLDELAKRIVNLVF